ncbi:TrmH family RNA methyltransferase [Candidatus Ruminimicrobiellum ovillum]|uniref:TrmH family RNA methyltransferase n=1 Tax=Candidatus Ruminimicrobiellum ovillum TaxID=1947927 RepID=UPI003559FC0F
MFIESVHNDIIKLVVSLKEKKNRDEKSLFVVEGFKQVSEIPKDWKIKFVLATEKYKNFSTDKLYITTEKIFRKISDTKTPQEILAVAEKKFFDIETVLSEKGFFVVIDTLQDPGNIGTIIRTAEAFGCKGIFMSKNSVDIYGEKVVRSTMGAIFNIPVIQECDIVSLMLQMKQKQINTCAFSLDTDNVLSRFKFKNSTAIIIGNESNGINKDVLNIVDDKIKIDMWGKSQSLNAAVACSIAVYEVSKQLNGK